MNVWYLAFATDSLTYTIAKALSYGGHDVFVWVADAQYMSRRPDGIQQRLRDIPRVKFVVQDESQLPSLIERLIVQTFPRPTEVLRCLRPLARRARTIAVISAGDRSRSWGAAMRLQWLELKGLARYATKIDRMLYKDGCYRRDVLGLLAPRLATGFDVHSQFLHDAALFGIIHSRDWDPDLRRPILVNFLGCQDPEARKRILDSMRHMFRSTNQGPIPAITTKAVFWHEYSDAAPVGLGSIEFVQKLSSSDFTLCPRGYSVVTHRPIEALLRGSIPVVSSNELDLYGVDLEDAANCVAVSDEDWPGAIQRLARMKETEIIAMRRNIYAMFNEHLNYEALSKRIRTRLGVAE